MIQPFPVLVCSHRGVVHSDLYHGQLDHVLLSSQHHDGQERPVNPSVDEKLLTYGGLKSVVAGRRVHGHTKRLGGLRSGTIK